MYMLNQSKIVPHQLKWLHAYLENHESLKYYYDSVAVCSGPVCDKERGCVIVPERQRWKQDKQKGNGGGGAPTQHSNGDVVVCKSHSCQETRKLKELCTL